MRDAARAEPHAGCCVCGSPGWLQHTGLRDQLHGVPGTWSFIRCSNPNCGTGWLNYRPNPHRIGHLYERYHTHDRVGGSLRPRGPVGIAAIELASRLNTWLREDYLASRYAYPSRRRQPLGLACLLPTRRAHFDASVMHLAYRAGGRLLDVGCGNGQFMASMRQRGWSVRGVEPDPQAAAIAREEYGLDVHAGTLGDVDFPAASFDAVTLSHVIEHVHDPWETLRACHRLLVPGGYLVITTPNTQSAGHRVFGAKWRGLEPPRHLQIYSPAGLARLLKETGFRHIEVRTHIRDALVPQSSLELALRGSALGKHTGVQLLLPVLARLFVIAERVILLAVPNRGEEIIATCRR